MKRVLFLCTGNAVRSQMAEAIAREFHGLDAVSAGSRPAGWVHPMAIRAMAEVGVDISAARSKSADEFLDQPFDAVVTVCDNASLDCPTWPGAKRIDHWPIEDPSWGVDDPTQKLNAFAATRDELRERIARLAEELGS